MEMDGYDLYEALISAAMESNEKFAEMLKSVMKKKGITVRDLSAGSGVPVSTINKMLSEERDIRLSTFREVIRYIASQSMEVVGDITVGIIAARPALNALSRHQLPVKGKKVIIKEYPANNLEEAIICAIRAERNRVQGLVCASIVATTVEKFVRIPIVTIKVEESNIIESLKVLVDKILSTELV
ncbi:MAG: helix-turn-helix domain-containing protein [Candidatus Methanosuratincola sp.]|nr:helix-turn-helix domain-containing protein [Candidatus Methanosuratincola sp.]